MSPLTEVALITSRELSKSFRTAKGVIVGLLALGGGGGAAMLFAWLDRMQRERLPPDVDPRALQADVFTRLYGSETGKALSPCPYTLWLMLVGTLWVAPVLVALMGFDAIAADVDRRTVRYWIVRTRRASFVLGKLLGTWLVVLAVMLGMNVIVWGVTAAVGGLAIADVLGWGARFFLVLLPITAAWTAIAACIGAQFRTPRLALLAICATFFGLWLLRIAAGFADAPWLLYAYPNAYDRWLLSPKPLDAARGLLGTGAITVVGATAAALLFERKDL